MAKNQEHDLVGDDRKITADFSSDSKMYYMPTGLRMLPFVGVYLLSTAK